MYRRDPVGSICRPFAYGSWDEDGPEIICCVDGQHPEIHEVWTFREGGVTPKVHPAACIEIDAFLGECFATENLTPTWCRLPMFGKISINGSVKWLVVPNFLRNDGPPWTLNLLAPYSYWWERGSSTIPNLGSGSGGHPNGVSINWNRPARVLTV